jgi:glutaredoxin/glutathione-dependent peroxiredoxin
MTLAIGQKMPDAAMSVMGPEGPAVVQLSDKLKGRKTVVFALPGAFTGPCSTSHIPSFIRTIDAFKAKGVEEVICIAVNDPFVLKAWGEATGATAAGIVHLGDADGSFTKGLGMDFTAPAIGLFGRSNRWAALVEDGVITALSVDEPGVCDISTGEKFLETI